MSTKVRRVARPTRRLQGPRRRAVAVPQPAPAPAELDTLASRWQLALDAEERALAAAAHDVGIDELVARRRALVHERLETARLLETLARERGIRPAPWLPPAPVDRRMLGLPQETAACVFDLDGVLTDSAALHAWAWGEVLDELLLRLAQRTGWQFIPFDRDDDYRTYIEGRSRLEGVHAFLDSRGISLPAGRPDDAADAHSAYGLAKRKGEMLAHALRRRGVTALPGVRRYLQAAGHAGIARAVVSASASTAAMLDLAGLGSLVEARVDADAIAERLLRTPPAPDLLLAACARLELDAAAVVAFTHTPAGVAAGRAAGARVVAVGTGHDEEVLRGFGAEQVVPSLAALLDPRLAG